MSYRGHAAPGSPQTRELPGLVITKASVGSMDNNAYFLRCPETGQTALIDAAAEPDTLLAILGDGPLESVITTHQHQDHWSALGAVVKATGASTIAGAADVDGIPVSTDRAVGDGDRIEFGQVSLEVIHIVGHTPGSICLLYDDPTGPPHLWTGDSLFPGGVGNTFGSADNFATLIDDVEQKLFGRLPDETWFYPGHGDDSTLGNERPHLAEWRARGW